MEQKTLWVGDLQLTLDANGSVWVIDVWGERIRVEAEDLSAVIRALQELARTLREEKTK